MNGQLTIFDYMPIVQAEPEVGAYIEKSGAPIPHIMRPGYIGQKVCVDVSTQNHEWYQVGILEKVIPAHYYNGDQIVECDRSIVYTGKKQRSLITHMPGNEIYECLPWDAYPKRMAAIGKH